MIPRVGSGQTRCYPESVLFHSSPSMIRSPGIPACTLHCSPKACYLSCDAHAPCSWDMAFHRVLPCTLLVSGLIGFGCFSEARGILDTCALWSHAGGVGGGGNCYPITLWWSTLVWLTGQTMRSYWANSFLSDLKNLGESLGNFKRKVLATLESVFQSIYIFWRKICTGSCRGYPQCANQW